MSVLVLGHTGMLGHTVVKHLENNGYDVKTFGHRWPSNEFKTTIQESEASYLINCIGQIPQKLVESYDINFELPIWLDKNFKGRIIHAGSDCESEEDQYGASKRKASDWICNNAVRTKIIKCSIIGPELNSSYGLLEWFLKHNDDDQVNGYTNHEWNGVTTLEWAKYLLDLMDKWDLHDSMTILSTSCISKYTLLQIINRVYDRKIKIVPIEAPKETKRCLNGIKRIGIEDQLKDLK